LLNIFECLINSHIPNINEHSIVSFEKRFLSNITDEEINERLNSKINENYDSWFGWAIDIYHGSKFFHWIYNAFWQS
jgi:hypothetical protein